MISSKKNRRNLDFADIYQHFPPRPPEITRGLYNNLLGKEKRHTDGRVMIDHVKFQSLVKDLYKTVGELEEMFPGRHFTPDGHMVGSIGECLVADAYNLELLTASNKGFDAISPSGKEVEIKATQSKSAAFRHEPEHAIVIKIEPDGTFKEIYNGPGSIVWAHCSGKKMPSNGQYSISLNQLKKLNDTVDSASRIEKNA